MALVYIGLGSNLGDRLSNLKRARTEIINNNFDIVKESSIEETDPVDFIAQPKFLNQVMLIKTEAAPAGLLQILKKIEKKLGRESTLPKGPRIIDLDILLYDDIILNTDYLTIPHPEIKNRKFVMKHLLEIDPGLADPATGVKYCILI